MKRDIIYIRGRLPEPSVRKVAIVGARAASARGMQLARDLAADLAWRGVVVVSGGAIGIDTAAHRGALEGSGTTVAVLASGLDHPYPARNLPLFDEIVRRGGAVVSPFAPAGPGTLRRWHFPKRNETIAALADMVVVIEAGAASGSLYTAMAARRLGRGLGACAGTPGTRALLAQGAVFVERADDVIAALDGAPRPARIDLPAVDSDEGQALGALDGIQPRSLDEVARLTGMGITRIAGALCALELDGLALPVPGGSYVRAASGEI